MKIFCEFHTGPFKIWNTDSNSKNTNSLVRTSAIVWVDEMLLLKLSKGEGKGKKRKFLNIALSIFVII